ncbi:hypothetical protein NESM_000822800 [Novymonas esmeraldas]|uniref:Uncharacterized protein n=1 Tax=Novymonas esmeraldas TaxID=1808958 RepID=A0AAW0EX76_9TRYP
MSARVTTTTTAAAASGAAGAVRRLVPSRLRIVQRDFLTRRGGRTHQLRSAVSVDYTESYFAAYRSDPALCPRLIDAEAVHGDEQRFWLTRREFYRGGASRAFAPVWDRQAQALIQLTRDVPRIPQEAAFRLFTLGLKMMLLPRLVAGVESLLPMWVTMNAETLLGEALESHAAKVAEDGKAAAGASTAADAGAVPTAASGASAGDTGSGSAATS